MNSRSLIAGLCISLLPLTAAAVPVTYEFSGQITSGTASSPPDREMVLPIIPLLTTFSGSFTYDNETPVSYASGTYTGYANPILGATISFGPSGEFGVFNFLPEPRTPNTSLASSIGITNDLVFDGEAPYDQFSLGTRMGNLPGDPADMYRYLSFGSNDDTGLALPPGFALLDPLPVEAFLANFHQLSFGYAFYTEFGQWRGDSGVSSTDITLRLVPTSVPEPATLGLMAAGLLAGCFARRRRAA